MIQAALKNPGFHLVRLVLALVAIAISGCTNFGSVNPDPFDAPRVYQENHPEAPLALPIGFESEIANIVGIGRRDDNGIIATELSLWPYKREVQLICVVDSNIERMSLPPLCQKDLIATTGRIHVVGDADKLDPEVINANWEVFLDS